VGDDMKKLMILMLIILLSYPLVLSLEVENCKSNDEDWECEIDEICVCEIEGTCTDGVLLVYEDDVSEMLCMPEIDGDDAEFTLDSCGSPGDEVKVRADCDEGQSDEEDLEVIDYEVDTTTTRKTTTTRRTTTTTRATTTAEELEPCPIDYECCEGELYYEDELCPVGMECCYDHVCKEDCGIEDGDGINWGLIAGIIVAIVVVFLIYTFFIKRKRKMTFRKLYEKWT